MKINTVKEIRELSNEISLEDGTKKTVYPGDLTGYLVNGSIYVPLDSNNRLYKKIQKSSIEIEPAYTDEELLSKVKEDLINKIQNLCDTKTQEAKAYINGAKVTTDQLARYEEKYQIAAEYKSNGNYADTLKLEADLQGLSVDDLADLIIAKGHSYKQALIGFNAKIEAFRVALGKIIKAGDLDKATAIIINAKELGANATDEDVAGLFT